MIVDWATYKDVTGDIFTAQIKAEAMLTRAQARIEGLTGRKFDLLERTESLPVMDGKVWPRAYPIASVSLPTTATVSADGLSIAVAVPSWAGLSCMLTIDRQYQMITYIGGLTALTAPVGLLDAICELAQRYCQPANTAGVPAGVTSVSVNGQSYSGGVLGGAASIPPALRSEINKYRHVSARMAD